METTERLYDEAVAGCREIFIKKTRDYGTSWRVLRPISIADQLFIKAQRVRNIQQLKTQKIGDDIASEFQGMVNYGVIGLVQASLSSESVEEMPWGEAANWFDIKIAEARRMMLAKNHDYGEAWRDMSQESFVDLILMKLLRIRQILANEGRTLISEGMDSNLIDIINYSLFALILIGEGKHGRGPSTSELIT